eukprot:scaffold1397_cov254-Pinguiococcus_pyrenoidosus.AAC.40
MRAHFRTSGCDSWNQRLAWSGHGSGSGRGSGLVRNERCAPATAPVDPGGGRVSSRARRTGLSSGVRSCGDGRSMASAVLRLPEAHDRMYAASFPGRRALRCLQALLLPLLGSYVGLGTYYAWLGVMREDFAPGRDFEACFVADGGGGASSRFVEAAASMSLSTSIFAFLALLASDFALRHPSWLLPSMIVIHGLTVSSFLAQDLTVPFPTPEEAWATQLTMWAYVSLDMYECLGIDGCELAGVINVAWIWLQLAGTVVLIGMALLMYRMYSYHSSSTHDGLAAAYARMPARGEDIASRAMEEADRLHDKARYGKLLFIAGGTAASA